MINSSFNYHEINLENAQDLFMPFLTKACNSKLTRLQSLIELVREMIFFIPKTIKRKYFIDEFNKKINLISTIEENLQANDLENPNFIIDACAKRLKQLNSLYNVHLLIKNYYRYNSQSKTESLVKNLIIKNQLLINKYINETENKKNDLIAKPMQPHQEKAGNEENEPPIFVDEQAKNVETVPSIELSEKPEDVQTLPLSLIGPNNSDLQIGVHESSEMPPKPNNSEGLVGRVKKWTGIGGVKIGIKNIKAGTYSSGIRNLSCVFLRMVAIAAVIACVAQNQILVREKAGLETQNQFLLWQQTGLEDRNQILQGEKTDLVAKYEILQGEKTGLDDQNQILLGQKAGLETQNQFLMEQKTGLDDQNQLLLREITSLVALNQILFKEKTALESHNTFLESSCKKTNSLHQQISLIPIYLQ